MFSHTRALTFVLAVLCAVALGEAEASRRSVSCECRPASGGRYNLDVTWRNLPTTRPNYFVLQEHSTYVESCDAIVTKMVSSSNGKTSFSIGKEKIDVNLPLYCNVWHGTLYNPCSNRVISNMTTCKVDKSAPASLSGGIIAAITVGCLLVCGCGCFVSIGLACRNRKPQTKSYEPITNEFDMRDTSLVDLDNSAAPQNVQQPVVMTPQYMMTAPSITYDPSMQTNGQPVYFVPVSPEMIMTNAGGQPVYMMTMPQQYMTTQQPMYSANPSNQQ